MIQLVVHLELVGLIIVLEVPPDLQQRDADPAQEYHITDECWEGPPSLISWRTLVRNPPSLGDLTSLYIIRNGSHKR